MKKCAFANDFDGDFFVDASKATYVESPLTVIASVFRLLAVFLVRVSGLLLYYLFLFLDAVSALARSFGAKLDTVSMLRRR